MSDKCLRAIRKHINTNIPSVEKLRKHREGLRREIDLNENKYGYFNDLNTKLTAILERVSQGIIQNYTTIDEEITNKQIFCLKFSGDGTSVSRNIHVFNFVFSCLNEGPKCKTASGHYTLGIFKIEHEDITELRKALQELSSDIKNLSFVEIGAQKYRIKKYLAGDLKFLAIAMGVSAANGNHPCPWCQTSKDQFKNPASYLDFSMLSHAKGARSEQVAAERINSKTECYRANRPDHKECHLGYSHPPIDFGIRYNECAVDLLHLFLRVSGTILDGFRDYLQKIDSITSDTMIKDEESLKKRKFYFAFVQMLRNTGIPKIVTYYQGIKFKDLTGPEYLKLFENLEWSPLTDSIEISNQEIANKIQQFKEVSLLINRLKGICSKQLQKDFKSKFIRYSSIVKSGSSNEF